jgi:hypothetical protein
MAFSDYDIYTIDAASCNGVFELIIIDMCNWNGGCGKHLPFFCHETSPHQVGVDPISYVFIRDGSFFVFRIVISWYIRNGSFCFVGL